MSADKKPHKNKTDSGLSLSRPPIGVGAHPGGELQHGPLGQAERAFSAASTFLSGVLAISASQFIGAPLKYVDPKFYDGYMAWTKESFAVLVTTITQYWAPTVVRVTGDESMKGQLFQMPDGSLRCNFPHRLVMMANHQLYTDWLYLWWTAYTNKMHGRIYIILKEELKKIPIFGWAAQFYNFIFLARKWETDKPRFRRHLDKLGNPDDPMWLLIFPEGTNLSAVTREKSKAWADKSGVPDMKHQLLPRSTGLHFCLDTLKNSTNWLYDCTIAYEGVPAGQYGQDIFTLRSSLFEGRPPKSVNMYWRRWRIADIPIDNEEKFAMWLRNRWTEKDYLLEHFARHKTFPEGDPVKAMKMEDQVRKFAKEQAKGNPTANIKPVTKSAKFISTTIQAGGIEEFMGIFSPVASAATALSSGQLNPENIDFEGLLAQAMQNQDLKSLGLPPIDPKEAARLAKQAIKAPPRNTKTISGPSPTQGKRLDPEVAKVIDGANEAARRRLAQASGKTTAVPPNVRKAIPMTPPETFITRPVSTIAMQRAAQMLQKAGPALGAKKKDMLDHAAKSAQTASRQAKDIRQGRAGAAARPTVGRRDSVATVQTIDSESSEGSKRPAKLASRPKSAATGAANGAAKKPHPLAGRKVGGGWKGQTPIGQKKEAK